MNKLTVLLVASIAVLVALWFFIGTAPASQSMAIPRLAAPAPEPLSIAAAPSPAPAEAPGTWEAELQGAIIEAANQNKDVLLQFSSNGPAGSASAAEAKLDSNVFSKTVSNQFVLVRFECHAGAPLGDQQAPERDAWTERLGVQSFPFLVLLDRQGRPCASLDLATCQADALESSIASMRDRRLERDAQFAKADHSTGSDRAKALDAALALVTPYATAAYVPIMRQIVAADPDDYTHLRNVYRPKISKCDIDLAIQHEIYPMIDQRQFRSAIARIDMLLHEESPPADQRQLLLAFQGQLYRDMGDDAKALHVLDQAVAAAPDTDQVARIVTVRNQILQHASHSR